MTDGVREPSGPRDPFEVLRDHAQMVALLERPTIDADDLVDGILLDSFAGRSPVVPASGARRSSPMVVRAMRRRRRWAAAAVAATLASGAGVAALSRDTPANPAGDLLCRSAIDGSGVSIAIELGDDPVEQCVELWQDGSLPSGGTERPLTEVPPLLACTGRLALVEVIPVELGQTCGDLGMVAADTDLADRPEATLATELEAFANTERCRSVDEVLARAHVLLRDLGLDDTWSVDVGDPDAPCAAAAIDPLIERIVLRTSPIALP